MRYCERSDVLAVISEHPEGITVDSATRVLFPDRTGSEFSYSRHWVRTQIQKLRQAGDIEIKGEVPGYKNIRARLWGRR